MKASKSPYGEGKNAIQDTGHIRTMRYPNGNQGFSEKNLGRDTIPGPMMGAPLSNKVEQIVTSNRVDPTGMNPYNSYEGNKPGVLGGAVVAQDGGRTLDSPVPMGAPMPNIGLKSKAAEASDEGSKIGDVPHPAGVLGRG